MNSLFKKINTTALTTLLMHKKIVVGLSGGADSVFLLHYLVMLRNEHGIELIAAHLDHEWRQESSADAAWCKELCSQLNVPLVVERASMLNIKKTATGELKGRLLRRTFFEQVMKKNSATAIALAHHADDVIETFFIRLIRGSSLSGLACLTLSDGYYLHPLITIHKQEILTWLKAANQEYRIDATNDTDVFLRNNVRNNVLPLLQSIDDRFSHNALSTIEKLRKENHALNKLTDKLINDMTHENAYQLSTFAAYDEVLQKRILIKLLVKSSFIFTPTTPFLDELLRFLHTPRGGSHQIASPGRVVKKSGFFWFEE